MFSTSAVLFFIVLLLIAMLLEPVAKKARLPFSIILVIIGFIGSEVTTHVFDIDTGIRWDNFKFLIFYVILPILIFQASLEINTRLLWKNLITIAFMALPLMVLSAIVTAVALYFGINHPTGFPWIAAFIAGALLSATDPAAVLSLLKQTDTSERLQILLEGESLFNDATAIVLFSILISLATASQEVTSINYLLIRFLEVFFGGLLTGVVLGLISILTIRILKSQQSFVLISLFCAYASFIIAEDILHFSGVIAVLSSGIIISLLEHEHLINNNISNQFWEIFAKLAEAMIFLLAGLTITLSMFTDQWLAIIIGITAVIISRLTVILGFFPIISRLPGVEPVSLKDQSILVWGGIRGTVTLALALSLPLTLDYWYTIQSIAYGVVIFTLFFQTTTLPLFLKK